jgi:hypothetical protein
MSPDLNDPEIRKTLTARGITAAMLLDMSPFAVEVEITQALMHGSRIQRNGPDSTGFDDEFRAYEAGQGQEKTFDMLTPDQVTDPFRNALTSGLDLYEHCNPFEVSMDVPNLVLAMAL